MYPGMQNKGTCYEKLQSVQVDHLYIDLNSLLHHAIRSGECHAGTSGRAHEALNLLAHPQHILPPLP